MAVPLMKVCPKGANKLFQTCVSSRLDLPYYRPFSVLNRPPRNYPGHVPLNNLERGALALGSAIISLLDPRREGQS